jgi:hypothetical protein
MAERTGTHRVALWVLLEADRLLLAAVLTVVVFLIVLTGLSVLEPPFTVRAAASDPIETLFAAMITAVVTVTTFVVTIGQLVLAQENGPLGDQRERMDNAMAVREDVQRVTGAPSPTDPAAFLGALLTAATEQSRRLHSSVHPHSTDAEVFPINPGDRPSEMSQAAIRSLAAEVREDTTAVLDHLDGAAFGSFAVVGAALNVTYDTNIVEIERIESEHRARLTVEQRDTLAELKETLSLFASAREHVKTLYFQWALIDLSRVILYAAIPALVVAAIAIGVLTPATAPGRTLGVDHIVVLLSAAFAVTFLPFAIFTVYVLRVLTVTKRTLAIDPLVLRDSEGEATENRGMRERGTETRELRDSEGEAAENRGMRERGTETRELRDSESDADPV